MWSAVKELRATTITLDTLNRECVARCDELEKNVDQHEYRINALEELVQIGRPSGDR